MPKISSNVKNFFITAGSIATGLAAIVFKRILDSEKEKGYSEAMEKGITNTIMALYDAGVNDKEIYRALYEHWNIPKDEAKYRVAEEISQATIRELEDYMRQLSYSDREIDEYMESNDAVSRIKRSKELWKLRCCPEKLMKTIQESK